MRRILIFVLALGGVGAFLLVVRPAKTVLPPIILFPASYQLPSPAISPFARWVPPTPAWAWLWRLKETVVGKVKPIEIDTDILDLPTAATPWPGPPAFEAPGSLAASRVRVWQIETAALKSLRQKFKTNAATAFLNSPRITTGDGLTASLFAGQNQVLNGATNETGVRVTYGTHAKPESIDLTASFSLVETSTNEMEQAFFRTNLDVKGRFQIHNGTGLFLMESFPEQTNRNPVGILLSIKR